MLAEALPDVLDGADHETFERIEQELREADVSKELARRVAGMPFMLSVFDIVEVAIAIEQDPDAVMHTYFSVGARLELNWLRGRIIELPRDNRWQALARAALRDDLYSLHRELTQEVLESASEGSDGKGTKDSDDAIDSWTESNSSSVERCLGIIDDIKASRAYDMTTLPVGLREVRNLIRSGPFS
jgi:glutamate dehydrogenase